MRKESIQLGMHYSTAQSRLKKIIIFEMCKKLGLTKCYRCGNEIINAEHLSFDHKKPWLDEENAKELFWDINNVSFSHKKCNSSCVRHKTLTPEEKIASAIRAKEKHKIWAKTYVYPDPERRKMQGRISARNSMRRKRELLKLSKLENEKKENK
jgi:hypothetical protein